MQAFRRDILREGRSTPRALCVPRIRLYEIEKFAQIMLHAAQSGRLCFRLDLVGDGHSRRVSYKSQRHDVFVCSKVLVVFECVEGVEASREREVQNIRALQLTTRIF